MLPSLISVSVTPGVSTCCGEQDAAPVAALFPPAAPPWSPPPEPPVVAPALAVLPPAPLDVPFAVAPPRLGPFVAPPPAPRAARYCALSRRAPQAAATRRPVIATNCSRRCRLFPMFRSVSLVRLRAEGKATTWS